MVLRLRSLAWAVVVPAVLASPMASDTATLYGRVELAGAPPALPRPDVSGLGTAKPRAVERRRSVVYLETAPRAAFEVPAGRRARMDQRNETFVPHVLAVAAGTTVDFPNNDPTYHNVFSLSRARPFDLGRYAAGRSKAVLFDRPGIVRVFCDIHSHMNAWILVFAHRFFSLTDDEGRYRIDGIPAGSYEVRVWNEAIATRSQTVVIAPGAVSVALDFSLVPERTPR